MSQVEIIKFGVFYNEGARGNAGGAPSNDKVWGIARIDGKLLTFNGRRNSKLSFKTRYNSEMDVALAKWAEKTGGRTDGGDIYTELKRPDDQDGCSDDRARPGKRVLLENVPRNA